MRRAGAGRAVVVGSLVGSAALVACSLLVDTDANQCAVDGDCARIAPGRACVQGVCVPNEASSGDAIATLDAPSEGATTCATNHDCSADATVCRNGVCVSLKSAACPNVFGNYADDAAILFGAIVPTPIPQAPDYLDQLSLTGDALQAALQLASDDFASSQNPTGALPPRPGTTTPRPLALVVCTDGHSASETADATHHLAVDLHVPAIVGTAFSTYTRAIVSELAADGVTDVLVLVPRSSGLTPADNGGLFVGLAPVDDQEGIALAALLADREAAIKAALSTDGGPVTLKVALVHKDDAYGDAVAASLVSHLVFNGTGVAGNGSSFLEVEYGNPDATGYSPQFTSAALAVYNASPHVVFYVGTNEIDTTILPEVEANWSEPAYRPQYFLSGELAVPELWTYLANSDATDSLRKRILGTMTIAGGSTYNAFAKALPGSAGSAIINGAASAYDAIYMLAYSVAAIGDKDVTGPDLAAGFDSLAPGGGALPVSVGPSNIESTFATLVTGEGVSLVGASNPLGIDPTTHVVAGTSTQVWCVPLVGGQASDAILSGQFVDATGTVQGAVSTTCGQ